MLVQPDFNLRAQAPQRRCPRQRRGEVRTHTARRFDRWGLGQGRTAQEKVAACERFKSKVRSLKYFPEIRCQRVKRRHRKFEEAAMLQVQARKTGAAVHGGRQPRGARNLCTAAASGDQGGRFLGKSGGAHAACKPGPPPSRKHALRRKTCNALDPGQWQGVGAAFPGKIEVGDDDDEFTHERVF